MIVINPPKLAVQYMIEQLHDHNMIDLNKYRYTLIQASQNWSRALVEKKMFPWGILSRGDIALAGVSSCPYPMLIGCYFRFRGFTDIICV